MASKIKDPGVLFLLDELTKLIPKSGEDVFRLLLSFDPEEVIGVAITCLLKRSTTLFFSNEHSDSLILDDILLDQVWEKLNTGYWKDVNIAWRYLYTLISMMKMFSQVFLLLHETDDTFTAAEVMKTCDMGLLMGAPILDNVLAKMSTCVLKNDIITGTNKRQAVTETVDSSKRPKLDEELSLAESTCIIEEAKAIQKSSCPSLEFFRKTFLDKKEPVVITAAIDYWPAMSTNKWSLDYIKKVAGTRTVPIELGSKYTEESWSQTLMTVKEFIENYIENHKSTKGYLAQHQLFDQIPELQHDISVPSYCCLGERDDVDINAWFGPKGTVSPLHYDAKENLLTQVFGKKYVRLYSDKYTEQVYPNPHRLLHNTSLVDIEHIDKDKYPLFPDAPYWECILNPGEMLYIPSKYWHFVKSLSVSFSVSFWWE
ncbi:hypothetical protein SNE40_020238 [Patella caerulea]|uniref:JmjC domain-containing protein 5 n=1 Tax=Patella caerulea TaxID=87958 RepID=A0AAN8G749_PATCE